MSTLDMMRRIKRIDWMISTKSTGRPEEFASRLSISERSMYNYLEIMKEFGAPIGYCRYDESYFYKLNGRFLVEFEMK